MYRYSLCLILLLSTTGCQKEDKVFLGYVEGTFEYISPTTSGRLGALYVKKGNYVQKKAPLFALDPTELKAAINGVKADIEAAKAKLYNDQKEFHRLRKLVTEDAVSHSKFDEKEAQYKQSLADLKKLHSILIEKQKKLEDSRPLALKPYYIEDTFLKPGEFVQAGQPVVSLLSPQNIKIRFFLPQRYLSRALKGKKIRVHYDGASQPFEAHITYISKKMEYTPPVIYSVESREKLLFMLEAHPLKYNPDLRPGLPVEIELGHE
jgi:HlyD family secretion protein